MRCNLLDEQTILFSLFGNRALYLTIHGLGAIPVLKCAVNCS